MTVKQLKDLLKDCPEDSVVEISIVENTIESDRFDIIDCDHTSIVTTIVVSW